MALFILEKLWRIGTLLLPSTLTIILSHSQTSIVFFLDNMHLIYTYLLGFVFLISFYLTFLTYILSFWIPSLSVEGCRSTAERSCSFLYFLVFTFFILFLYFWVNRRPVSSVGRASDYRAGGLGFEPQTGPTLRVLKQLRRICCLCNGISKWLDIQVFSDKDDKP